MDYMIRPMTIDDYDDALALWQRTEGMWLDTDDVDSREAIAYFLRRNAGLSFIARCDGTLIGAVLCGHDGRRGYLNHLAVDQHHRRRGIGSALAQRSLAGLHAAGISRCNLIVLGENEAGRHFWLQRGWVERMNTVRMQRVIGTVSAEKVTR
ncbi:MAG: GNAT family N-acetyltransferase [Armatimonadota bacterium]